VTWKVENWLFCIVCVHSRVHITHSEILHDLPLPWYQSSFFEHCWAQRVIVYLSSLLADVWVSGRKVSQLLLFALVLVSNHWWVSFFLDWKLSQGWPLQIRDLLDQDWIRRLLRVFLFRLLLNWLLLGLATLPPDWSMVRECTCVCHLIHLILRVWTNHKSLCRRIYELRPFGCLWL
jgi:hypothetical protein